MPTPAPTPRTMLVSFVEHLPPYARRLIVRGEPMNPVGEEHEWVQGYVTTLLHSGWTPHHIGSLFFSDLILLRSVEVFQAEYGKGQKARQELRRIITNALNNKERSHHCLPQLLDPVCWLEERPSQSVARKKQSWLSENKAALHRLGTFAQQLVSGEHSGHYLCTLPIGYGKTHEFLRPFAVHCGKQERGIIIAVERIEQVKEHTEWVNNQVQGVAFPLMGHDPVSCELARAEKPYDPIACAPHHKEYAKQAKDFPVLFVTHSMLSRLSVKLYHTWKGGTRKMVIIDEKPSAWWSNRCITTKHLYDLGSCINTLPREQQCTPPIQALFRVIEKAEKVLSTSCTEPEFQLSPPLPRSHVTKLYQYIASEEAEIDTKVDAQLCTTLEDLYSLGQSKGMVVCMKRQKEIIVARRAPLPNLPTIILDGTGEYDPAYPTDIVRLDIDPWEGITPPAKQIRLITWNRNLTKDATLKPWNWKHLRESIEETMAMGQVYVLSAKQNEDTIRGRLENHEEWERLHFTPNHYGNTKGSNDMRDATAIVFTSVQFKRDEYYRAIALATGKDGITAKPKRLRGIRVYPHQHMQAIKLRDTIVTLIQEIGRTRIRQDKSCQITVLLPWSDPQGIPALIHQLGLQFQATIEQEQREIQTKKPRTQLEQLLSLLQPGLPLNRRSIEETMGLTTRKLEVLLGRPDTKKELWGREIETTYCKELHAPAFTCTQVTLALARKHLAATQTAPLATAA